MRPTPYQHYSIIWYQGTRVCRVLGCRILGQVTRVCRVLGCRVLGQGTRVCRVLECGMN